MKENALVTLKPLLNKNSKLISVEEFHTKINTIFHDIEAKYYDTNQKGMWENLPEQLDLLIKKSSDQLKRCPLKKMKLMDVGCGTGLATSILLKTELGDAVEEIFLLDTSEGMLEKALQRSVTWGKKINSHCGYLGDVKEKFDIIIVSSVLHHIPDLTTFFNDLENHLNDEGLLITLQDPLSEAVNSDIYKIRCENLRSAKFKKEGFTLKRILRGLSRRFQSLYSKQHYIEEINGELLKQNIIHTRLTHEEMWSVTDIHVEGLPYSNNKGISIKALEHLNNRLKLISYVTYCFFGSLKHYLPDEFKAKEEELTIANDRYGRNFGSLWIKSKSH